MPTDTLLDHDVLHNHRLGDRIGRHNGLGNDLRLIDHWGNQLRRCGVYRLRRDQGYRLARIGFGCTEQHRGRDDGGKESLNGITVLSIE